MPQIAIDIPFKEIEKMIDQLGTKEKTKILEKLNRETTRKERWNPVVTKIREQYAKNPISEEEITKVCEEVRQEIYEERLKSRKNKNNR